MSHSSSDDDSFHSASGGDQNISDGEQNIGSLTSVSTQTSNLKAASFADSKESKNGFEKVEKQFKDDNNLFKVPNLPTDWRKKNSTSSNKSAFSSKHIKIPEVDDDSDDDNDWFKAQMDEFKKSNMNQRTSHIEGQSSIESDDEKKLTSKTIWDWTGIHDVVNAVGEGFSNVVEAGLGLPHAEDMAKLSNAERRKLIEEAQLMKEPELSLSSDEGLVPDRFAFRQKKSNRHYQPTNVKNESPSDAEESSFPVQSFASVSSLFSSGGLFSSLVLAPLDVLESLGKKTFETLTVKNEYDGDKRRFFLQGENSGQSLSEILRELREEKEEYNLNQKGKSFLGYENPDAERFNTNFVSLFEKNEGLVHLEGLELLSNDQERRSKTALNYGGFEESLLEFCVEDVSECLTEDFEDEFSKSVNFMSLPFRPNDVLETNRSLTQELAVRQAAVDANKEIVVDAVHEAAITALAKLTADSISSLHKIAQLIVIAKNLPEMDSLFAFTYLLCRRLSFFATQYTNILTLVESSKRVDEVVTNIFFECSNACHYIKKALELLRPFFKSIND